MMTWLPTRRARIPPVPPERAASLQPCSWPRVVSPERSNVASQAGPDLRSDPAKRPPLRPRMAARQTLSAFPGADSARQQYGRSAIGPGLSSVGRVPSEQRANGRSSLRCRSRCGVTHLRIRRSAGQGSRPLRQRRPFPLGCRRRYARRRPNAGQPSSSLTRSRPLAAPRRRSAPARTAAGRGS